MISGISQGLPWLPSAIALNLTANSNLLDSCILPCIDSAKRESFYALLNFFEGILEPKLNLAPMLSIS